MYVYIYVCVYIHIFKFELRQGIKYQYLMFLQKQLNKSYARNVSSMICFLTYPPHSMYPKINTV